MTTLRADWPNEARQHEKIKPTNYPGTPGAAHKAAKALLTAASQTNYPGTTGAAHKAAKALLTAASQINYPGTPGAAHKAARALLTAASQIIESSPRLGAAISADIHNRVLKKAQPKTMASTPAIQYRAQPKTMASTPAIQYRVAPHRPKRKRTVEFKGNSHPERKGKHTNGRQFPAHIRQRYRDTDMWYTSDDKRRFENDPHSLHIVTGYQKIVENTPKREIVPRRKFTNPKPTSKRNTRRAQINTTPSVQKAAEDSRWRLHVQRFNEERATLADKQRADEDRRRRNVELINGAEYHWAPGAISTGSTTPLAPTANPYDALKLPATQRDVFIKVW